MAKPPVSTHAPALPTKGAGPETQVGTAAEAERAAREGDSAGRPITNVGKMFGRESSRHTEPKEQE